MCEEIECITNSHVEYIEVKVFLELFNEASEGSISKDNTYQASKEPVWSHTIQR
jgi:hypothetical protein